jgi:hypothetical protein
LHERVLRTCVARIVTSSLTRPNHAATAAIRRHLVPGYRGARQRIAGRGGSEQMLFLVQSLADQWGYLRSEAGTTVWFRLARASPAGGC